MWTEHSQLYIGKFLTSEINMERNINPLHEISRGGLKVEKL